MSNIIEEKVVGMKFDNSNFERNVSQSMDSLNKFDKALSNVSSTNAFSGLANAVKGIDFSGVSSAIQVVTDKFNFLEETAIGAARRIGEHITDKITNAIKAIPDRAFADFNAGFSKYTEKTEAVQTIMSSITDQDFGDVDKLEYVNGLMDKLNWFTDETSYNLTDMISNIGKFTAAGVDLDVATTSMMGIANWAAISGQNAASASRAMYNISQALGTGAVQLIDWKSIENANMATKEFKELAISVAEAKGVLKEGTVTYATFRDSLKDKWFTADVLNEVLGQYSGFTEVVSKMYDAFDEAGYRMSTSKLVPVLEEAQKEAEATGKTIEEIIKKKYSHIKDLDLDLSIKDENGKVIGNLMDKVTELGIRAFKAAQEYKTFQDALDATKDAAGTAWMNIFETIFGGLEEAKRVWTKFGNSLYDIWVEPINELYDLIYQWSELKNSDGVTGRELLIGTGEAGEELGALFILLESFKNLLAGLKEGWESVFPPLTAKQLVDLTERFRNFALRISITEGNLGKVSNRVSKFLKAIKGTIDTVKTFIKKLDLLNRISEKIKQAIESMKTGFSDTFGKGSVIANVGKIFKDLMGFAEQFVSSFKLNVGFFNTIEEIFENIGTLARQFKQALFDLEERLDSLGKSGFISKVSKFLSGKFVNFLLSIPNAITGIISRLNIFSRVGNTVFSVIDRLKSGLSKTFDKSIFGTIRDSLSFVGVAFEQFINGIDFSDALGRLRTIFSGLGSAINIVGKVFNALLTPIRSAVEGGLFAKIGEFISKTLVDGLLAIPQLISRIIKAVDEFIGNNETIINIIHGIGTVISQIVKFVLDAASAFKTFVVESKFFSKAGDRVSGFFSNIKEFVSKSKTIDKLKEKFISFVEFFRDNFYFDNFMKKLDEIKSKFKEMSGNSELFKQLISIFEKIGKKIRGLFGKKEESTIDSAVEKFDNAAESIAAFAKKVTNRLKEAWDSIKSFLDNSKGFQTFKNSLVDSLKWINEQLDKWLDPDTESGEEGIFARIKKFFKNIFGGDESDALDSADAAEKETKTFWQKVGSIFSSIWEFLKKIGSGIKSAFSWIEETWNKFEISERISSGFEKIKEFFSNLVTAIRNIFKGTNGDAESQANFESAVEFIKTMLGWVLKLIGVVLPGLAVSGVGLVIKKIFDGILSPVKAASDFLETAKDALSGYVSAQKTKVLTESFAEIFSALAKFILAVAAAIAILVYVDSLNPGKMTDAMIGLGAIITAVSGIVFGLIAFASKFSSGSTQLKLTTKGISSSASGLDSTLQAIGLMLTSIGVAVGIMIAAAALLVSSSNGDVDTMWSAVGIITAISVVVVGLVVALAELDKSVSSNKKNKGGNLKKLTIVLLAVAVSISMLAKTAAEIGKEDSETLLKGVGVIAALGALLMAFSAVSGNSNNKRLTSAGIMILLATAAISVLVKMVKKVSELSASNENIWDSVAVIGALAGIIAILGFVIGNSNNKNILMAGASMLIIAGAIVILANAIKEMAQIDSGALTTAVIAFAAVAGSLVLLVGVLLTLQTLFSDSSILAGAVGLLLIAASIKIILDALIDFTKAVDGNNDVLITAGIAIGGLIVALALLAVVASLTGPAMLAFGAGLLLVGAGVFLVGAGLALLAPALIMLAGSATLIATALVESLLVFLNGIIALQPTIVKAIGSIIDIIVETITKNVTKIAKSIVELFTSLLKIINENFNTITTILGPLLNKLIGFLKPFVERLIDWLLEKLDYIINGDKGLLVVIDNAINGSNGIIAMIEAAIPKLLDLIKMIISDDGGLLYIVGQAIQGENGILTIIHAALFDDGGVLWMIHNLLMGDNGILTIIHDALFADGGILPMVRDLVVGENGVLTIVKDALIGDDGILGIVKGLLTGENGILTIIDDAINGESGILNIIDKAINGEDGILAIAGDAISGICELIKGSATDVVNAVESVIKTIADGLTNPQDGIIATLFEGVTTAINLVASRIVALAGTIFTAVVDVINGLAEQIETNAPLFWSAIKRLAKAIWDSLFGIIADKEGEFSFFKLGKAAIDGFIEGITSFIGGVNEAAMQVPDAVKIGIESGLAIQSPSKVMHQYGMYTVQGFANGIKDNVHIVDDSASSMSKGMIETIADTLLDSDELNGVETGLTNNLSDILSGVTDSLSSDIMNPVITPVLDLSELETGTKQMSGMLDMNNDYAIGTAITGASYNPYEYYDGTEKVDDVQLRAESMAKLEQKLDEAMARFGRAKVVLDTGAMVGELRDPMDLQLGRKAALIGRGTIPAVTIPTNL